VTPPALLRFAPAAVAAAFAMAAAALPGALACASSAEPKSYRLTESGTHWDHKGEDRVLEDVRARYPAFFEVVLDPSTGQDPNLLPLRRDLEHEPVDQRNFDALNAIAIAYFELNYRATERSNRPSYFSDSFRAAQILAVPWRAYGEVESDRLRTAILDFFEDAGTGEKLGAAHTAPRLAAIVESLERKEEDEVRRQRIRELTARLEEIAAQRRAEANPPLYRPPEEQDAGEDDPRQE